MSRIVHTVAGAVVVAIAGAAFATPAAAQAPETEKIVEIMRGFAGPTKARPSGAKGQCYKAEFVPSVEARGLSASEMFAKTVPALVRFSVGGGNPKVPDATKTVNRGFSVRFDPDGKGTTEFVMVNAPVNFVRSPAQMLAFLQARLPGADGKPDAAKIKAFTDANPETTNQGRYLAGKPVVGSWVGVTYYGIHPYTLVNAGGSRQVVKFRMRPLAGEIGLTDDEAKAKPADFLVADISARLAAKTPAGFEMLAIIGSAAEAKSPATEQWTDEDKRPTVRLGVLNVTAIEKNETCDGQIFDPVNLAPGILGPDDPLFRERQPAYAISISQRN